MPMTTQDARLRAPLKLVADLTLERRNVAVFARPWRRRVLAVALLCVAGTAQAQSPGEAIGAAAEAFQFRSAPPPAADFVERARPDAPTYERLAPTDTANHRKSAAELDALASSLESAKAANQRAAQRVRAQDSPAGTKTAKAKPESQNR